MRFKVGEKNSILMQWAASLFIFASLIYFSNRGLDMTDESYYILWAIYPDRFDASVHPFGLFLHPLMLVLGQSIVALRIFGIFFLASSGFILGFYIEKYYRVVDHRTLSFDARALTALFAMAGYVDVSILTPSYNMLANVASCLVFSGSLGWVICDSLIVKKKREEVIPSLLVGIGGALAALAKPTFALLALMAITAQLVVCWGRNAVSAWRRIAYVLIACMVPLTAALTETISPEKLLDTFRRGQSTLNFGNNFTSLPYKTVQDLIHMPPPLILICLACIGIWKIQSMRPSMPRWISIASHGVVLFAIAYLCLNLGRAFAGGGIGVGWRLGPPVLATSLSLMLVSLMKRDGQAPRLRTWWPVVILMLLPFAIAFGTANSMSVQISVSLYAMLLSLAIVVEFCFSRCVAMALQVVLVGFTVTLLVWTSFVPYGLPGSIWAQTTPIRFQPTGETLYVDSQTAAYTFALKNIASANCLKTDTPIIDLSGGGPGTTLMLGGRAPYFPWIVPNFGHPLLLANTVWASLSPADQRRAWVILPAHPALADSDVLRAVHGDGRYHLAGRIPMTFWNSLKFIEVWAPSCSSRT